MSAQKVDLLEEDQGVIYLDTEVSDRALQLRVAEQKLASLQVARALVDECNLRPARP